MVRHVFLFQALQHDPELLGDITYEDFMHACALGK